LASLLSPEKLQALNLRESPAAKYVLTHLPEASSEEEFMKLVAAVEKVGIEEPKIDLARLYGLQPGPNAAAKDPSYAEKQAQLAALLAQIFGERGHERNVGSDLRRV
jgi:hypothetical protein